MANLKTGLHSWSRNVRLTADELASLREIANRPMQRTIPDEHRARLLTWIRSGNYSRSRGRFSSRTDSPQAQAASDRKKSHDDRVTAPRVEAKSFAGPIT